MAVDEPEAAGIPEWVVTFGDSVLAGATARGGRLELALTGEGSLNISEVIFVQAGDNGGGEVVGALRCDFNGSGTVDFQDFFLFADAFGSDGQGPNAPFDLDVDGDVDFDDFFAFADTFGTSVTP